MTDDAEPPSGLAQLTAEIVSAYVSHNQIALPDLAKAHAQQRRELALEIGLGQPKKPPARQRRRRAAARS